ncbi:MAG: glycosyl hydrolase [Chthoniobacter sp.]|nr:glycosyl hydrolase [Chthoniobacter sp.]
MIKINFELRPADLRKKIERLWELSVPKILAIDRDEVPGAAPPVFTIQGKYTSRGWTEWTQGFVYGSALLQFDAFWDETFLKLGRDRTFQRMAHHVTHMGVHDHGFNNVSTYGNLWRLMRENRLPAFERERDFYELALKCSGAVQANRWTHIANGEGFIYSFNGPHSLFADTIRSLRVLALSHKLGHVLMGERDEKISLLRRLVEHARTTAKWTVYYGTDRDAYDVRGRVAHESLFNVNDGSYRCPGSQQGYASFSTWTRGLAWVMLGYAEQLEFIATLTDGELEKVGGRDGIEAVMLNAARASCDFYIESTPVDGIPYWDTGAPGLAKMGNYLERPAEPFNDHEPVDSSAAAIAAQGLLRLGNYLTKRGQFSDAERYWQAGLTVLATLFDDPYLSTDTNHQGLLLHSVYHRPNGWDFIPTGRRIPCGESSMWGDYHAREVALYVQRTYEEKPYLTFFGAQ